MSLDCRDHGISTITPCPALGENKKNGQSALGERNVTGKYTMKKKEFKWTWGTGREEFQEPVGIGRKEFTAPVGPWTKQFKGLPMLEKQPALGDGNLIVLYFLGERIVEDSAFPGL